MFEKNIKETPSGTTTTGMLKFAKKLETCCRATGTSSQYSSGRAILDEIVEERTVLHRTTSTYLSSEITSRKGKDPNLREGARWEHFYPGVPTLPRIIYMEPQLIKSLLRSSLIIYIVVYSEPICRYPMTASTMSLPCFNELSQQQDPLFPTYITTAKKRGKILVINNMKFLSHIDERKAAKVDGQNLKELFKNMGFDFDFYIDLKQEAMLRKITKFKNDTSLKEVDISMVIILNHGYIGHNGKVIHGGFRKIYGIDGIGLPIEDVLNQFSVESCPAMAGKPKIFIFQSCRGRRPELIDNDETSVREVVKKNADMLVVFSVLPSFYGSRNKVYGSYYVQYVCHVFEKYAKEFDIEQLWKIMEYKLDRIHANQQIFAYKSQGFKRCYLNPKRNE